MSRKVLMMVLAVMLLMIAAVPALASHNRDYRSNAGCGTSVYGEGNAYNSYRASSRASGDSQYSYCDE